MQIVAASPASSGSTGFDIMQVLRDEKRRQERLRAADEDDQSIRSGSSYNGTRLVANITPYSGDR